ncbi:MAG TPA: glucoamylase family protein [Bryobacteraceae bacterium]|nr:glucoamylase family protein [Bryobacteraceae bacterium]
MIVEPRRDPSRRRFLGLLAGAGVSLLATRPARASLFRDSLLDEVERRAFQYFYEMADPKTGLVLDRALVDESYSGGVASIAATGFGLSALAVGDNRGFYDRDRIRARVRTTLKFLCDHTSQERGFFYHFLDSASGERAWASEVSSIDTAWLLCGVLHARAHWNDAEIHKYATELLNRADWNWMLNDRDTLSHGWMPESGFVKYRWDSYSEDLAMYLLAISSEKHPIPATCWNSFARPLRDYEGITYIDASTTPLFVHQYSHAWFDFRHREDRYANYFLNSVRATEAHRLYCMGLSKDFPWYGPDMWGVTASDSRNGYRIWGSPANPPDGTLVPCAAGGSLGFLPELCGAVMRNMHERYNNAWSRFGFVDAFHPKEKWYSRYVIGIDVGITMLMAENARSGSVWQRVMSTPEAKRGMDAAGLGFTRS